MQIAPLRMQVQTPIVGTRSGVALIGFYAGDDGKWCAGEACPF